MNLDIANIVSTTDHTGLTPIEFRTILNKRSKCNTDILYNCDRKLLNDIISNRITEIWDSDFKQSKKIKNPSDGSHQKSKDNSHKNQSNKSQKK
jgi:hypothetical protein